MTNILTYELCDQLFTKALLPLIKGGADAGLFDRFEGGLVVMRPQDCEPTDDSKVDQLFASFGPDWAAQTPGLGDVLYAGRVLPDSPDSAMYLQNALGKAVMCQRTGLKSSQARYEASYSYRSGDCLWGGAVIENGLAVGFSGLQEEFDEAIATTMLSLIRGACQAPLREHIDIRRGFSGWLPR